MPGRGVGGGDSRYNAQGPAHQQVESSARHLALCSGVRGHHNPAASSSRKTLCSSRRLIGAIASGSALYSNARYRTIAAMPSQCASTSAPPGHASPRRPVVARSRRVETLMNLGVQRAIAWRDRASRFQPALHHPSSPTRMKVGTHCQQLH